MSVSFGVLESQILVGGSGNNRKIVRLCIRFQWVANNIEGHLNVFIFILILFPNLAKLSYG
jgi:hypothetical protein